MFIRSYRAKIVREIEGDDLKPILYLQIRINGEKWESRSIVGVDLMNDHEAFAFSVMQLTIRLIQKGIEDGHQT